MASLAESLLAVAARDRVEQDIPWSLMQLESWKNNDTDICVRYLACLLIARRLNFTDAQRLELVSRHVQEEPIFTDAQGRTFNLFFTPVYSTLVARQAEERLEESVVARKSAIFEQQQDGTISIYGYPFATGPEAPSADCTTRLEITQQAQQTMRALAQYAYQKRPVVLVGPSGCGKTFYINTFAALLGRERDVVHLNVTGALDAKTLLGNYVTTQPGKFEFHYGAVTRCLSEGKILVIEGLDLAPQDVQVLLSSIADRSQVEVQGSRVVKAAAGFFMFATISASTRNFSNLHQRLTGREDWQWIHLERPSSHELYNILLKKYPGIRSLIPKLLAVFDKCEMVRDSADSSAFLRQAKPVSVRDLFVWCSRIQAYHDIGRTGDLAFSQGALDSLYLDACDLFAASIPDLKTRQAVCLEIAQVFGMPPERAEAFCTAKYKPEYMETPKSLVIGRSAVFVRENSQNRITRQFSMTKHASRLMEQIAVSIRNCENLLLVGETGVGKTTVIQHIARYTGNEFVPINLSQQTEAGDLIGSFKPIDVRFMAKGIMEHWKSVFPKTFSVKRNQAFDSAVRKAYSSMNWNRLAHLLKEGSKMAKKLYEAQVTAENTEEHATKRRKLDFETFETWNILDRDLLLFNEQVERKEFQFKFVEGILVKALRKGQWVLLDEINLASAEVLETVSQVLSSRSILLSERGDVETINAHPNFRIFAAMNPASDVGKRAIARGIRSFFTEIYVTSPDDDFEDLYSIVVSDIRNVSVGDERAAYDFATLYSETKDLAKNGFLQDGSGNSPVYSIRTLSRALEFARNVTPEFGLRRSLYEGFCMCFLTALDLSSANLLAKLSEKHILHGKPGLRITAPVTRDDTPSIVFKHYRIDCGPSKIVERNDYILTPFIETNLLNLVRAIKSKYPVLLQGPTSSGKTSMIEYLANITGNEFVRINNHEHTDIQEYLGTYVAMEDGSLVYQEGLLLRAVRHGYWIILDELNLAPTDVLESLNRLLDDNHELFIPETQEIVKAHPNFFLFATQNPAGLYGGRKHLSRAFRNRFLELHFDDIPENELETILYQRCRIAPSHAARILNVYRKLESARQSTRIFDSKNSFATLRDLFRWGNRQAESIEQLAIDGFMLLGERSRTAVDRELVKKTIEEVMRTTIDERKIYDVSNLKAFGLLTTESQSLNDLVWTKAMSRLFLLVEHAMRFREPILLVGETGSGKTTVFQAVSSAAGKDLSILNAHQNLETSDILGSQRPKRNRAELQALLQQKVNQFLIKYDLSISGIQANDLKTVKSFYEHEIRGKAEDTELIQSILSIEKELRTLFEWYDGPLVKAMKDGGFFLLDEISLAEDSVLERLNSVLEPSRILTLAEKGSADSVIKANDGFQFFATMNPGGDYGKRELSPALRNRFTEIWAPNALDEDDIRMIIESKLTDVNREWTGKMLEFSKWFFQTFNSSSQSTFNVPISIRDVLSWSRFMNLNLFQNSPWDRFVQGALLVYVDGFGTSDAANNSSNNLNYNQIKTMCLEYMHSLYQESSKLDYEDPKVLFRELSFEVGPYAYTRVNTDAQMPKILDFFNGSLSSRRNALKIMRALQIRKPILLEGSPGVGKSSLIERISAATGNEFTRINLSEQTDLVDLFGCDVPVEGESLGMLQWRDAAFLKAMQKGTWVLLDEMNLAPQSVLEGLNSCFDHRGEVFIPELGRYFTCHPNFKVFAAQNPHRQGGGRKGLPKSFLNRFSAIYMEDQSHDDLRNIARLNFSELDAYTRDKVVLLITRMDELCATGRINLGKPFDFNMRDTWRWLELLRLFPKAISAGFRILVLARLRSEGEIELACSLFREIFGDREIMKEPSLLAVDPWYVKIGEKCLLRKNGPSNAEVDACIMSKNNLEYLGFMATAIEMNWPLIFVSANVSQARALVRTMAAMLNTELEEINASNEFDSLDLIGGYEQRSISQDLEGIASRVLRKLRCEYISSEAQELLAAYEVVEELLLKLNTGDASALTALLVYLEKLIDVNLAGVSELYSELSSISMASNMSVRFSWVEGRLLEALKHGKWILIHQANLCSAAVLDRLNSLLETNGAIQLTEHPNEDGSIREYRANTGFRLFMTVDNAKIELSRPMRNRCVEIYHLGSDTHKAMPIVSCWDKFQWQLQHRCEIMRNFRAMSLLKTATLSILPVYDIGELALLAELQTQDMLKSMGPSNEWHMHLGLQQLGQLWKKYFSLQGPRYIPCVTSEPLYFKSVCSLLNQTGNNAALPKYSIDLSISAIRVSWALDEHSAELRAAPSDFQSCLRESARLSVTLLNSNDTLLESELDDLISFSNEIFLMLESFNPANIESSLLRLGAKIANLKASVVRQSAMAIWESLIDFEFVTNGMRSFYRAWKYFSPVPVSNANELELLDNLSNIFNEFLEICEAGTVDISMAKRITAAIYFVSSSFADKDSYQTSAPLSEIRGILNSVKVDASEQSSTAKVLFSHADQALERLGSIAQFGVKSNFISTFKSASCDNYLPISTTAELRNMREPGKFLSSFQGIWAHSECSLSSSLSCDLRTFLSALNDEASQLEDIADLGQGPKQLRKRYWDSPQKAGLNEYLFDFTSKLITKSICCGWGAECDVPELNLAHRAPMNDQLRNLSDIASQLVCDENSYEAMLKSSVKDCISMLSASSNSLRMDVKPIGQAMVRISSDLLLRFLPKPYFDPKELDFLEKEGFDIVDKENSLTIELNRTLVDLPQSGFLETNHDFSMRFLELGKAPESLNCAYRSGISKNLSYQLDSLRSYLISCELLPQKSTAVRTHVNSKEYEMIHANLRAISRRILQTSETNVWDLTYPLACLICVMDAGLSLGHSEKSNEDELFLFDPSFIFENAKKSWTETISKLAGHGVKETKLLNLRHIKISSDFYIDEKHMLNQLRAWYTEAIEKLSEHKSLSEENSAGFRVRSHFLDDRSQQITEILAEFTNERSETKEDTARRADDFSVDQYCEIFNIHESLMKKGKTSFEASISDFLHYLAKFTEKQILERGSSEMLLNDGAVLSYVLFHNREKKSHTESQNFYLDSNLDQLTRISRLFKRLRLFLRGLKAAFPDNQVITDMVQGCETLLQLASHLPLSKVINFAEQNLDLLNRWQDLANREWSVDLYIKELSDIILDWRKIELNDWTSILELQEHELEKHACTWWFQIYAAIALNESQDHAEKGSKNELLALIATFFEQAPVAEYEMRLKIIDVIVQDLKTFRTSEELTSSVFNVYNYYKMLSPEVISYKERALSPLKKQMKEHTLLFSWKENNIFALKESSRRSHVQILKMMRKHRELVSVSSGGLFSNYAVDLKFLPYRRPPRQELEEKRTLGLSRWEKAFEVVNRFSIKRANRHTNMKQTLRLMQSFGKPLELELQFADYAESIVNKSKDLAKMTPASADEKSMKKFAHVKVLKQRFLSDIFKTFRESGYSGKKLLKYLDPNQAPSDIFSITELSLHETPEVLELAGKTLRIIRPLRDAKIHHHEDIKAGDCDRILHFLDEVLFDLDYALSRRAKLAAVLDQLSGSLKVLSNLELDGESFCNLGDLNLRLCKTIGVFKTTQAVFEAANNSFGCQSQYEMISSVTDILTNLRDESLKLGCYSSKKAADFLIFMKSKLSEAKKACEILKADPLTNYKLHWHLACCAESLDVLQSFELTFTTGEFSHSDFDSQLSGLADMILGNLEEFERIKTSNDFSSSLRNATSLLRCTDVNRMEGTAAKTNAVLSCFPQCLLNDDENLLWKSQILSIMPIVDEFYSFVRQCKHLADMLIEDLFSGFVNLSHLSLILLKSGFCEPKGAEEESHESKDDGMGLGTADNADAKDITEDVDSEDFNDDDMLQDELDNDISGEKGENGLERDEDLFNDNASMHSVSSQDDENSLSEKENEESDIQSQIGEVEDAEDLKINESLWDEGEQEMNEKGEVEDKASEELDLTGRDSENAEDDTDQHSNTEESKEQNAEKENNKDTDEGGESDTGEEIEEQEFDEIKDMERLDSNYAEEQEDEADKDLSPDIEEQMESQLDQDINDEEEEENANGESNDMEEDLQELNESDSELGKDEMNKSDDDTSNAKDENTDEVEDDKTNNAGGTAGAESTSKLQSEDEKHPDIDHKSDVMDDQEFDNNVTTGPAESKDNDAHGDSGMTTTADTRDESLEDSEKNNLDNSLKQLATIIENFNKESNVVPHDEDSTMKEQENENSGVNSVQHVSEEQDTFQTALDRHDDAEGLRNEEDEREDVQDISEQMNSMKNEVQPSSKEDEEISDNFVRKNTIGDRKIVHEPSAESTDLITGKVEDLDIDDNAGAMDIEESRKRWNLAELETSGLGFRLAEQLRLILEPTVAAKMRGDYKTGKRINLKRIIPYVASDFKRDKIWMRRTKPSKRQYQVMIAVDNSKSMLESGSESLTLQSMALIAKGLTLLEAGEIAFVKFDESAKLLHAFSSSFTSEDGAKMCQHLDFASSQTNMVDLVEKTIVLLRNARELQSAGDGLWQLGIIVSDGIHEGHEKVRRLLRKAREDKILIMFVIIDALHASKTSSILDMNQVHYDFDASGNMKLRIESYMSKFAFDYYLIVQDVSMLPEMLAMALRQWFAEVNNEA